ncbi:class I SAM-dependent methyltransferase [Salinigranum salinum]|uniref:class I SAM-dependent methyltransferase n=1 Tax=Salinigranum salinum TaxID=1364937 RepID=UPI001260D96B|nr:class I SAM-dependent methyltransferase [Salinigranum salinum]
MKGDFERYLAAKATVDDRALDRRVLERAREGLNAESTPRVLEAGAGTGAFLRRVLGWEAVPDCTYVAVDTDPALLATARDRVVSRARDEGFEASVVDPGPEETDVDRSLERTEATTVAALSLRGPARIDVRLVAGDAVAVAEAGEWDWLVAQAFVDLLTPDAVGRLVSGVRRGGGVYFPITFDGGTAFVPEHPADAPVLDAYHATMADPPDRLGATAGRRLLALLPERGIELDAVGGSDWVVTPHDGAYPADEDYFLEVVVDTVADAVRGRVASETVESWLDARQGERAERQLRFVARNLDLYGHRA